MSSLQFATFEDHRLVWLDGNITQEGGLVPVIGLVANKVNEKILMHEKG